MTKINLLILFLNIFPLVFPLEPESIEVRSCEVNGKIYREFEDFATGIDGCAKCVCTASVAECDLTKCQPNLQNSKNTDSSATNKTQQIPDDFINIKNQIAKQYFADYDAARLKIITDALGCKSTDCPQLMSATNIEYNIVDMHSKQLVGRGDRINKIVIQSTDTEVMNSSPAQQKITTIAYVMNCIRSFEVTIEKTTTARSEKSINLWLYKKKSEVIFTQKEVETYSETNETTIFFPSQNVTVSPFTKLNVTFNFFQFDDINKYFVDFEIALNSTISHPDVDANSNVIFVKKPFGDFFKKHEDFLESLKYTNDTVIKLMAKGDKYVLRNFPTSGIITGYGVDVVFGNAGSV